MNNRFFKGNAVKIILALLTLLGSLLTDGKALPPPIPPPTQCSPIILLPPELPVMPLM